MNLFYTNILWNVYLNVSHTILKLTVIIFIILERRL